MICSTSSMNLSGSAELRYVSSMVELSFESFFDSYSITFLSMD